MTTRFSGESITMPDGVAYKLTPLVAIRPARATKGKKNWTRDEILVVAQLWGQKNRRSSMAFLAKKLGRSVDAVSFKFSNLRGTTNGGRATEDVARLMKSNPAKFKSESLEALKRMGIA
jgi:hypothetical protein